MYERLQTKLCPEHQNKVNKWFKFHKVLFLLSN